MSETEYETFLWLVDEMIYGIDETLAIETADSIDSCIEE